jgi:hypothetical protein
VMSSVGAVVLPCVLFYLFPFRFSRSAHRLPTGREVFAHLRYCVSQKFPDRSPA